MFAEMMEKKRQLDQKDRCPSIHLEVFENMSLLIGPIIPMR